MSGRRACLFSVLLSLLLLQGSAFVEELDDSFMETKGSDEIWLIEFYAPWCSFCKQLDPVWHEIGSELRSLGSMVQVGKSDATVSTGLAKEFRVRTYPAILMLKKNTKYNYAGPRTKEGIMDFANRMEGPVVRSLSSPQLFQHAMSHHNVMFVYVGATSELKGNFTTVAEELIVHTHFFSTTRDVLPKSVSLDYLPAIVVFKDRTYLTYDEESDGDLKAWINRERFLNFQHIDSYTLYAMGESGKLVLLALVEERHLCSKSLRYKHLVERVAEEHKETYSRFFLFGFMAAGDYINGFVMGEVTVPSLIAVNLSNDGYYQPAGPVETERQLLDFLDGVLDGTIEMKGGNGFSQRVQRVIYETKATVIPVFRDAPLIGCFLAGFPLAIGAFFCFLCCRNQTIPDDDEDTAALLASSVPQRKKIKNKKSD
ncbi:protein disulfide-isomerase TMX3-like [Oryzias latipes]|uniref:protein disulfide-isomerase n=1 Tax=Oryzias latipes TaxID=8090 RepID=H2LU59_ORYLA|nr:protein disulfide-isomerase TMX3-like [Oryzias latipes]